MKRFNIANINNLLIDTKRKSKSIKDKLSRKIEIYLTENKSRITTKFQSNGADVSLKQSNFWAQSITWSLIGGTVFGFSWLALAETEEIIIVQGKLEPIGGVVDLKIPFQGVVKEILVKEGQLVEKDQLLIKLDTEINRSTEKYLKKNLGLNQDILERLKFLVDEGAVSELQYLEQKNKIEDIQNKITQNNVTLKYQEIKSPIKGLVFDLKPRETGFVANSNNPLLKIVPLNKLQAKVDINSQKIGFVKVGQKADISIDSYPASDFGVIEGEITKIGSDALPPDPSLNKGFRFPAKIKIDTQYLSLTNGKQLPLQTGMSMTANIKLRKVSYLQLLLGTFQDKASSLKEI